MADFANPTQVSEWALGLSRRDYMGAWSAYTDQPAIHLSRRSAGRGPRAR